MGFGLRLLVFVCPWRLIFVITQLPYWHCQTISRTRWPPNVKYFKMSTLSFSLVCLMFININFIVYAIIIVHKRKLKYVFQTSTEKGWILI